MKTIILSKYRDKDNFFQANISSFIGPLKWHLVTKISNCDNDLQDMFENVT